MVKSKRVKSKRVKSKRVKPLRKKSKSITRKIMYGGVKTDEFGIAVSIRNILKKYTLNHGDWKINSTNDYGDGFDLSHGVTALWCINQIIHSNDINKENDEEIMGMKTKFGEQGVSKPVTMEILNIILEDLIARFDALVIPDRMVKYGVDKPKVLEQINSIKEEQKLKQTRGLQIISQLPSGEKSEVLASLISGKKEGGKRSLSKKRSNRKTKINVI